MSDCLQSNQILPPLHPDLIEQYNISLHIGPPNFSPAFVEAVSCLLLSPHAILPDGTLSCCESCFHALKNGNLLKFSIANHNAIGLLPSSLDDLTVMEIRLCSLIVPKIQMKILHGGQREVLSHGLFYDEIH